MLNRRTLFKVFAALGAGGVLPLKVHGGITHASHGQHDFSTGESTLPGKSLANPVKPIEDLLAIEQWENLLDDLDAAELIGRYVALNKPKGSLVLQGRCPFCHTHDETFTVHESDDTYLCLNCLSDGTALDFYARLEGMSLGQAASCLQQLLDSRELEGKRPRRDLLQAIVEETGRFAHDRLFDSEDGQQARTWLERQGIDRNTVQRFCFGVLSSSSCPQLVDHLISQGFSHGQLEDTGMMGWLSVEEQPSEEESHVRILMPVREANGDCYGFFQHALQGDENGMSDSCLVPYGSRLLSPNRARRLVYSAHTWPLTSGRCPSVLLASEPWDIVALYQGGIDSALYVGDMYPMGSRSLQSHFALILAERIIWPLRPSEQRVSFFTELWRSMAGWTDRLAFIDLSETQTLSDLLRDEGVHAFNRRLNQAKSLREVLAV
jgi:hypothetical protein